VAHYLLRVEGVNFGATVTDTQDLSCIRGSSLALLNVPQRIRRILEVFERIKDVREIFSGASQAAFQFVAEKQAATEAAAAVRQALEQEGFEPAHLKSTLRGIQHEQDAAESSGSLPLAHLSFVVDLEEIIGDGPKSEIMALERAEARNRARQLHSLTVRLPHSSEATMPDARGGILPADNWIRLPVDGSVTRLPDDPDDDGLDMPDGSGNTAAPLETKKIPVARSVAARRIYGRYMRQAFYWTELDDRNFKGLRFTDSIETICADPPKGLPESIVNKIALIYFDGNKFGKTRELIAAEKGIGTFAVELKKLRREKLLRPVISAFKTMAKDEAPDVAKRIRVDIPTKWGVRPALRFETLLWGGDEVIWVAPAWLAFWLVGEILDLMRGWQIEGHELTHAGGVVICDRKTPIRQAVAMAHELADNVKKAMSADGNPIDAVQIEVFESVDLPDGRLDDYRRAMHPGLTAKDGALARLFTLPGAEFSTLVERIAAMKAEGVTGVPRSQIYRLLNLAVQNEAFGGGDKDDAVKKALNRYRSNAGRGKSWDLPALGLWHDSLLAEPGASHPLSLSLALIARYWDFVAPFDLPPLPPLKSIEDQPA
jgi:hypothetical protein